MRKLLLSLLLSLFFISNSYAGITATGLIRYQAFDINDLTLDTSIASSDYIPFYDLSAESQKKITYSNFVSGISSSLTLTNTHILVGNASNVATDVAMSGDATIANTGALTLSTVNGNIGSFGSSTSIPTLTINAKGLITAASGNAVIAPAGTLTGTTLAANVVSSSLTSVGTIATGVWQGTRIGLAYGGTNADLSATGGASQVLQQTSSGAAITVGQLAASNLSNGTTGSGSVVLATSPSIATPTLISPIITGANQTLTVSAKTTNYQILTTDSNTLFTNTGALGALIFTLPPSPNLGETHGFCITTAQTLEILANTGQTINFGGSSTASAGNIQAATIGYCLSIIYANTNQWYVTAAVNTGVWTIN